MIVVIIIIGINNNSNQANSHRNIQICNNSSDNKYEAKIIIAIIIAIQNDINNVNNSSDNDYTRKTL